MKSLTQNTSPLTGLFRAWPLWKLLIIFMVSFLLIIANFIALLEWPESFSTAKKIMFLNEFIEDFFIVSGIVILFYSKHIFFRLISNTLIFTFALVYFVQAHSVGIMGSFLPSIALENAQHIDILNVSDIAYNAAIWLLLLFTMIFLKKRFIQSYPTLMCRIPVVLLLILTAIFFNNDQKWLSKEIIRDRHDFFDSGKAGFPHTSPLSEMGNTVGEYLFYLKRQNFVSQLRENKKMSKETAQFVYRHYKKWGNLDADYPLLKDYIYTSPLPYKIHRGKVEQKNNIIIFFVEGMSARIIQPYSNKFPEISPNLDAFSKKSMIVNNYYNHTYATYRGIGGSLCSIQPVGILFKKTDYYCLPHILKEDGYVTRFLFSQPENKTSLDEMFFRAGFDHVDSSDTLSPLLKTTYESGTLTDKELIDGLIYRLQALENDNEQNPFLFGLYNFQTHTGIRLKEKESVYRRPGFEPSYVLNTIHNFDQVFGIFWKYFKKSKLYENTIVIVTSDHATFPSKDYINLTNYKIWSDKLPLLIYHPTVDLERTFNAEHVSSINLAPTLLHLMGVKNRPNAFLGSSIFDENANIPKVMTGAGIGFWYRDSRGHWTRIDNETKPSEKTANGIDQFHFISYCYDLERGNKLWKNLKEVPANNIQGHKVSSYVK